MGGYCLIHGDLVTDSAIKKDKLSGKDVLLVEISESQLLDEKLSWQSPRR